MANSKNSNMLVTILVLLLVAGGIYYFINGRDTRTGGEKVGDAINSFSESGSLKNAGDQLKDSTPAEKFGNTIRDKASQAEK